MKQGRLFVISAPSGAGKTTLLRAVMARVANLVFSISHTTRPPRQGEIDGVDYRFISRDKFLEMIDQGLFLEYARVHDNFYGTSRREVEGLLMKGADVVLDIDVQGADILRNDKIVEAAYIFISPPSLKELENRLRGRGTESEELIRLRLGNACSEMAAASRYDYLVINDDLSETIDLLVSIIVAERARAHRLPSGQAIDNGLLIQ